MPQCGIYVKVFVWKMPLRTLVGVDESKEDPPCKVLRGVAYKEAMKVTLSLCATKW